ncbi:MAG: hypothetical protein O7A09_09400, partial [Proteobacteria bacterium]|nr:hypothetical protein [Pseudomonadota bacterium]
TGTDPKVQEPKEPQSGCGPREQRALPLVEVVHELAEREPEIVRAQTLQLCDSRGFNTRLAPIAMALAKAVGPWLGRWRWAGNAWLRAQHDLRFGAREVTPKV